MVKNMKAAMTKVMAKVMNTSMRALSTRRDTKQKANMMRVKKKVAIAVIRQIEC